MRDVIAAEVPQERARPSEGNSTFSSYTGRLNHLRAELVTTQSVRTNSLLCEVGCATLGLILI
jgi:hypothetical protein